MRAWIWGVGGAVLIVLGFYGLSSIASSTEACYEKHHTKTYDPDQNRTEPTKTFWDGAHVWAICKGHFIDENSEVLLMVFTVVLAGATIGLWIATHRAVTGADATARDQLAHGRDVNRAYLGAGGDFPDKTARFFNMDFENNGKTPAFILSFDVHPAMPGQVSTQSALTVTEGQHPWSDTIPPWGRKSRMTTVHIPRGAAFVYGCVWYQDVWRTETRRSRFILSVDPLQDRTLSNVNAATVHPEYFERT